jgi:hypothetical protein
MNAERMDLGALKPDISAYRKDAPSRRGTDFSLIEVHVEVKMSPGDDPFDDRDPTGFEPIRDQARDTRNQIISYAVAQLAMQFRTHIFSVIIIKDRARLIRWDRVGAIVTASFPYCSSDSRLVEFFRRYNLLDSAIRGVDESVETPLESEAMRAREILRLKSDIPLVKLAVPGPKDKDMRYYIGPMPKILRHVSPTGRCTRTFVAYDLQTEERVFVKDTWRIDLPDMETEGEIYKELKQAEVSHIASSVHAADLPNHHTLTEAYVDKPWARPIPNYLRPHQHYRLVLGVVARPLTSFKSSWELVTAMGDALQGTHMLFML